MSRQQTRTSPHRSTKTDRVVIAGVLQILAGCVLFALFCTIAVVHAIVSSPGLVTAVLLILGVLGGTLFAVLGIRNFVAASRFRAITRAMDGSTYVQLSDLEREMGKSRELITKRIQRLMAKGFWDDGYLDAEGGAFVLGYTQSEQLTGSGDQAVDELLKTANGFLSDMKTVSLSVGNTDLKAQVERMTGIAEQIYTLVKDDPTKVSRVRQFSNYYLPTTVGLLRNYQELERQTSKGENILGSMQKIEGILDSIEATFGKQLDDLYYDKSLDIYVDIKVMQNMIDN